jgi:hypothetical protein
VRLTVNLSPELHALLAHYAEAYAEAYGAVEPLAELVPAMLDAFLGADRAFQARRRKGGGASGKAKAD